MRQSIRRRAQAPAEREVLSHRAPVRGLRYRGGDDLSVGSGIPLTWMVGLPDHGVVHPAARGGAGLRVAQGRPGVGAMSESGSYVFEGSQRSFATTRFEDLLNWAKKYSLFQYPF